MGHRNLVWVNTAVNRETHQQFDRRVRLDPVNVPSEALAEIDRLLGLDFTENRSGLAKYRRYFKDVSTEEPDIDPMDKPDEHFGGITLHEYYEDEDGTPLTLVKFLEAMS